MYITEKGMQLPDVAPMGTSGLKEASLPGDIAVARGVTQLHHSLLNL
jgi:hypothetical protein